MAMKEKNSIENKNKFEIKTREINIFDIWGGI